jgi:RNA polymerase sigma-70 factor (ECF subfamily)
MRDRLTVDRGARFERVFEETYEPLLAYARRRVGAEADDVLADTLAIAWRRLDDLPSDPLPWLYGVARRVISGHRRARRRRHALMERLGTHASVQTEDAAPTPDGSIFAALAQLSVSDQEAILLVAWEELTAERAAKALGCSTVSFRVRLHRARKRLRAHLAEIDPEWRAQTSAPIVAKEAQSL